MILKADIHTGCKVFDAHNNMIGFVQEYNTKTKEISMYILAARESSGKYTVVCELDNCKPVPKLITFILEGSYATDPTGKVITDIERKLDLD